MSIQDKLRALGVSKDLVERLAHEYPNMNEENCALCIADTGDFELLDKVLQQNPASAHCLDEQGANILSILIRRNRYALALVVAEKHSIPFTVDSSLRHVLHYAAMSGVHSCLTAVKKDFQHLVAKKDIAGRNYVHYAAMVGDAVYMQKVLALQEHMDLANEYDYMRRTLLHYAGLSGVLDNIRVVLKFKSELNKRVDNSGWGLAQFVIWSKKPDRINEFFTQFPSNITACDKCDANILLIAASTGDRATFQCVYSMVKRTFDQTDGSGKHVLHYAAESGEFILLDYLLQQDEFKYLTYQRDLGGKTFVSSAVVSRSPQLINKLLIHYPRIMKKRWQEAEAYANERRVIHMPSEIRQNLFKDLTHNLLAKKELSKAEIDFLTVFSEEWSHYLTSQEDGTCKQLFEHMNDKDFPLQLHDIVYELQRVNACCL